MIKKIAFLLFGLGVITAGAAYAQTVAMNSSIGLKKDLTGLFVLTAKDPEGIKEFWLLPTGKSRYGGELDCPRTFVNNTVALDEGGDFAAPLAAYIIDCQGNREDFTLAKPKGGATFGERPAVPKAEPVVAVTAPVAAPKPAAVTAPIPALGGCANEKECRAYCNDPAHMEACVAYGEKNNLLSSEDASRAKKFFDAQKGGGTPGACTSADSCASYCENIAHIDECIAFAEKHNFLSGEELADARRAAKAKSDGLAFPGGCTSKASCENYCEAAGHIEECLAFAEKSGFLPPEELAQARKVAPLIARGEAPGGCTSKKSCEAYCDGEGHLDECIDFGVKAGFVKPEEVEMIKKTGGKGPGGCHSKEQCATYCQQNQQDCMSWAKENGLEGEFSGPSGGAGGFSGPGGCKSQEECQTYCKDHQAECQGFGPPSGDRGSGEQHDAFAECGIVPGAVAVYVCGVNGKGASPGETTYFNRCHAEQQGVQILHEGPCGKQDCSDIADPVCTNDGTSLTNDCHADRRGGVKHKGVCTAEDRGDIGGGSFSGVRQGGGLPGANQGGIPGGNFGGGPGGCKSQQECRKFCEENPDACSNPGKQGAHSCISSPPELKDNLPGCIAYCRKNPESCRKAEEAYCRDNPENCPGGKFVPGYDIGGQGEGDSSQQQYQQRPSADQYQQQYQPPQVPAYSAPQYKTQEYPQAPGGSSYEVPATPELCANFSSTPSCSYAGSPGSAGYDLCKKCYPDR